tara:strand:- start:5640 stop:6239 length:600 start_codon:yes stop_codon:yes gene_type:complete
MNKYDILGYIAIGIVLIACLYIYFENYGAFDLKCIVSTVNGNEYCVRERNKIQDAADLLAKVTDKCKELVDYVYNKFPDKENVKRLHDGFNPKKVMETLPTSKFTAYSENKGEKIAFCLNKQKNENEHLIDESTLTFVAIHELSHVMTLSVGHKSEFWENFKFLLEQAKDAGIHNPVDYKKEPSEYCGMKIHDNPYYDA